MDWSYEGFPAGMFWLWVLIGALMIGAAAWLTARRVGRQRVTGSPARSHASDESGSIEFEEFKDQSAGRVQTP